MGEKDTIKILQNHQTACYEKPWNCKYFYQIPFGNLPCPGFCDEKFEDSIRHDSYEHKGKNIVQPVSDIKAC